jgi:FkbM family methyltransferase
VSAVREFLKTRLPGRFVRVVREVKVSGWQHENLLDDEAARAVIRACLLGDGGVLVDVGAYRGEILRAAVEVAPQRRHHAFEPGPIVADLRRSFPGVNIHNCCVGAGPGEVDLHVYRAAARNSVHRVPGEDLVTTIRTPIVSLDDSIGPSEHVSVVKIDVEGGELDVLRGATGLLGRCVPTLLFEHGSPAGGALATSVPIYELLVELGYRVAPVRGRRFGSPAEFEDVVATGRAWNFVAAGGRRPAPEASPGSG